MAELTSVCEQNDFRRRYLARWLILNQSTYLVHLFCSFVHYLHSFNKIPVQIPVKVNTGIYSALRTKKGLNRSKVNFAEAKFRQRLHLVRKKI